MRVTVGAFAVLCVVLSGCGRSGPKKHEVHGRVSIKGKGVDGAQIQFVHDQRDIEFSQKYNLPIRVVIHPDPDLGLHAKTPDAAFEDYGRLVSFIHPQTADSERTHGQSSKAAPVVRVPLSGS